MNSNGLHSKLAFKKNKKVTGKTYWFMYSLAYQATIGMF